MQNTPNDCITLLTLILVLVSGQILSLEDRRDNYPLPSIMRETCHSIFLPALCALWEGNSSQAELMCWQCLAERGGGGGAKYSNLVIISFRISTEQWTGRKHKLWFRVLLLLIQPGPRLMQHLTPCWTENVTGLPWRHIHMHNSSETEVTVCPVQPY